MGVNVGHAMDGKNQFYHRPVLIVRKFNPHLFFGVPLTSSQLTDLTALSTQAKEVAVSVRSFAPATTPGRGYWTATMP